MRTALLAALAALALPAPAFATTPWMGYQPVSTAATPIPSTFPFVGVKQALGVTPDGHAVALWYSKDGLVQSARRDPTSGWGAPQAVNPSGPLLSGTSIDAAVDDAGTVSVIWIAQDKHVEIARSTAGGPFATPVSVGTIDTANDPEVRIASSANGSVVAGFGTPGLLQAVTQTSPGAFSTPVVISAGAANHTYAGLRMAVNDSGEGIATWADSTGAGSSATYYGRTASLHPGEAWQQGSTAGVGPLANVIPPELVIDAAGRATATYFDNAKQVVASTRAPGKPTVAFSTQQVIATSCTSPGDGDVAVALDGAGTRTFAYTCGGRLRAFARAAGVDAAGAGRQDLAASQTVPNVLLAVNGDGQAVLEAQVGDGVRAFRRTAASGSFGPGEALADPDGSDVVDLGLDAAGDAIALTYGSTGLTSSFLDATPPTGSIDGPDSVVAGSLVSFKLNATDAFGTPAGTPTWTTTDGGAGSGASFERTFTAPGTYKVTVAFSDTGGNAASATKLLTVTAPQATPPPSSTQTVTTVVTPPPTTTTTVTVTPPPAAKTCTVPRLTGLTLAAATSALKRAGCARGKVTKPRHGRRLVVKRQGKRAKAVVPAGTKVTLTLRAKAS